MGFVVFSGDSLRQREFMHAVKTGNNIGVTPLPIKLLRKRKAELNKSNFSSERWFINIMEKYELKHRFNNIPVSRNHCILNRFYADFYFETKRIVVEIDGNSHDQKADYDKKRNDLFAQAGLRVIRVPAYNLDQALSALDIVKDSRDEDPLFRKSIISKTRLDRLQAQKMRSKRRERKERMSEEFKKKQMLWALGKGPSPFKK